MKNLISFNIPTLHISRSNNKLIKKSNDVIIFDKPCGWYPYHYAYFNLAQSANNALCCLLNRHTTKSNSITSLYCRRRSISILETDQERLKHIAELYNFRYVLYTPKNVIQFLGLKFENKNKLLLFKLKYSLQDYRDYEISDI